MSQAATSWSAWHAVPEVGNAGLEQDPPPLVVPPDPAPGDPAAPSGTATSGVQATVTELRRR